MQEENLYIPNNILFTVDKVAKRLGYTEINVSGRGQGKITTFYNPENESITYYDNIDAPSIFIDGGKDDIQSFKKGMVDMVDKYAGKVTRGDTNYDFTVR